MSEFVRGMLIEQRKRLVGSLMQHIEQKVYPRLNATERQELRNKVLTSVGTYHDTCLDMLKASIDDGSIINEEALKVISELNTEVRNLRRDLRDGER